MNQRIRVCLEITVVSGMLCWLAHRNGQGDFGWAIRAAQDLLSGQDPYSRPFSRGFIPYPLPAAFFGFPFVMLPYDVGCGIFFGLSSGLLAYGLTQEGYSRLLIFLSFPYWAALQGAQWTPLIMASAFFPFLLPVTLAKPQIGLPVASTHLSKKGVLLCLAVALLSLAWMPMWPFRWLDQIGSYQRFIPVLTIPGCLLLLSLLSYRDRSAQLLLLAAMMPQRWFYDGLTLWLIPGKVRQLFWTAVVSWLAYLTWWTLPRTIENVGYSMVTVFYLPMMGIVLTKWYFQRKEEPPGTRPPD